MAENAPSQNTISSGCQRARAASHSVATRMAMGGGSITGASSRRGAGEQSLRPPDQHDNHDGVDDEGAERRHVIFAGDVADAEQKRGEKRASNARCAPDRHHDQKVDHEFEREAWVETQDLDTERATEAGQARPKGESERENPIDVDAEPARHPSIVDGGAQAAAEARVGKYELQPNRKQATDHDDEQPVAPDTDAKDIEPALQDARNSHEDLTRTHDVIDRGHRHEYEADGEQHLIEVGFLIDMHIERALQDNAEDRARQKSERNGGNEWDAEVVDKNDGHISAGH